MTHEDVSDILSAIGRNRLSINSFGLVETALNKRVPMTPDIYGDGYADGELVLDMWRCPSCGTSFEIEYEKHDYCPVCGQAIDWSNYKE